MKNRLSLNDAVELILAAGRNAAELAHSAYDKAQAPYALYHEGINDPSLRGHNDIGDARRHAETSRRLSAAIGPFGAEVFGTGRELQERLFGHPRDEMIMDLHNNREGRQAYIEKRPIDERNLQTLPGRSPTPRRDYPYR